MFIPTVDPQALLVFVLALFPTVFMWDFVLGLGFMKGTTQGAETRELVPCGSSYPVFKPDPYALSDPQALLVVVLALFPTICTWDFVHNSRPRFCVRDDTWERNYGISSL